MTKVQKQTIDIIENMNNCIFQTFKNSKITPKNTQYLKWKINEKSSKETSKCSENQL